MADWTDEDEQPIANAIQSVALQIRNLGNGDAATPMGGLEALGQVLKEGLPQVAPDLLMIERHLSDIAGALDRQAEAMELMAKAFDRIAFQIEHTTWFGS